MHAKYLFMNQELQAIYWKPLFNEWKKRKFWNRVKKLFEGNPSVTFEEIEAELLLYLPTLK